MEITGNQSKLDACINLLSNYEILELARTGIAGLGRGTEDVVYLDLWTIRLKTDSEAALRAPFS